MVSNTLYQTANDTLTRISLLCTIRALDISNSAFQIVVDNNDDNWINYEYQLMNTLFNSCLILQSSTALREIASLLLQTLNVTSKYENISTQRGNQEIEIERFKQYLRKFTFFFRNYVREYPNQLSRLSTKKINMLAINNLFFICGL